MKTQNRLSLLFNSITDNAKSSLTKTFTKEKCVTSVTTNTKRDGMKKIISTSASQLGESLCLT